MQIKAFAQALALSVGLSSFAQAQSFPSNIPSSDTQLGVFYGKPPRPIQPGQTLPFSQRSFTAPIIGLTAALASPGPYLVTMVDPDAPTPANPSESQILHWLQPDLSLMSAPNAQSPFPFVLTDGGAAVATFIPPAPPLGSPPHHYIQLLWLQPPGFTVPDAFSGFGGENRTKFDVVAFAKAAGLQGPLASNYFLTSHGFETGNMTQPGPSGTMPAPTPTSSPPPFNGASATVGASAGIWAMGAAALAALL